METKKTPNSQRDAEKENQSRRHYNSGFQAVFQSCNHQNRHLDQWNRIENPEMDLQCYDQLIFDKAEKNIQKKKGSLFNKWCWENWATTHRRVKPDHFLMPYTKLSSKWMKDLNVRQESVNILEESTGSNLFYLGCSNFLLDTSTKARETKAK